MTARCYLAPDQWGQGQVCLKGREAHHLSRVLRLSLGEEFVCSDGQGREACAHILKISGPELIISLGPVQHLPELPYVVTLAVGIPGQGKLDEIVNQATQLGVGRLIPLVTQRSVIQEVSAGKDRKAQRWRRIAVEAIKQSGCGRLPEIDFPCTYPKLLLDFSKYDRVLLASVDGPWEDLPVILKEKCHQPLLLIGPEGDFSPQEIEQAMALGARRFSLGPTVLRCETACVAAVSLLAYFLRTQNPPMPGLEK